MSKRSSLVPNPRDYRSSRISVPFRSDEFIQLLLLVTVFTVWSYCTNRQVSIREIMALASLVFVSFLVGQVFLAFIQKTVRLERSFPMIWLTGLTVVGLWITLFHILTPFGLINGFFSITVLAIVGNLSFHSTISQWPIRRRTNFEGNLASVISLLAATFWLQHLFPQKLITDDTVRFNVFEQNFEHTVNMMALLTPKNPFAVGSIEFAGEPLSFYHWACYSPAALLHLLGGQPANDTMASLWYPLATYLLGLSAYVLGRTLFGPRAGLLATVGVVVLPDPTFWAGDIIVFSFTRMIEVSAGMGYACGAAVVALVLVIRGIRGRAFAPLAGIVSAFTAGLFKINIIAATLPATMFALFFFARKRHSVKAAGWIVFLLVLVGFAILAGTRLRSAPSFALDPQWGNDFVQFVLALVPADSWVRGIVAPDDISHPILLIWSRSLFILLATFQGLFPLYGLLVLIDVVCHGHMRRADQWILTNIAFYALLAVLLIPNANGDPFELQHRDFCWYYMLLIIGLAGFVARWLRRILPIHSTPYIQTALFLTLVFPLVTGRTMYIPSRDLTFARGFIDSTEFIRVHSNSNDIFLDSQRDPLLVSTALTERRSFIARERNYKYFPGSASLREVREKRWEESNHLFSLTTMKQISDWSRQHNVQWVLVHPETKISWPTEILDRPNFQSGKYQVYNIELSEDERR